MSTEKSIKDLFEPDAWEALCSEDPSLRMYESSSQWQRGYSVANTYFASDPLAEVPKKDSDSKGQSPHWRDLQAKCWQLYRAFGPVNASINSKADYVAGKGFELDSPSLEIRTYLNDLFYSYRNRLYSSIVGWMVRMQAEGELFLLLVFDEEGKATIRALEPSRIGKGNSDDGLLLDPDDATQTLFYHYYGAKEELIPDISIAMDPELLKKAKRVKDFKVNLTAESRATGKYKRIGGFRRFVLHWKNLTGIHEYRRDVSTLSTVIEAVNLYWSAIKWQLDYKKAQCAYTNVLSFADTPAGKIAWQIWNALSPDEQAKTGLTKQQTPGSTMILMPGISFEVKSPQLTKLSGENQDILNVAGAGARTPQDLWQGQSSGATYASLRSSRSPLEIEVQNLQCKLGNFIKYELLRACFFVASALGGFPEEFDKQEVSEMVKGKPKFESVKVEPAALVHIAYPDVAFEEQVEGKVNAYLGSQHSGLSSIGVSDERVAGELGITNLDKLRREQAVEREKFGEPKPRPVPGQGQPAVSTTKQEGK